MSATRLARLFVFFSAGFASFIAQAGDNGAVGEITHSPDFPSMPVPILGGAGLVVLAVLISLLGVRLLKGDHSRGSKWLLAACLTTALASGTSGLKLISDAYAVFTGVSLVTESGATLPMDISMFENGGGINGGQIGSILVRNNTGELQYITKINLEPNCQIIPEEEIVNAGNGGLYQGPCLDRPPTALDPDENCDLDICCEEDGFEGICDDWIENQDNGG